MSARRDRLAVWLLTGPVGRLGAFLADLAAYWWRWAGGRIGAAFAGRSYPRG